uniref:Uncharacterized protein n=1 Tax=Cannabis sativa TaxID=3483 RepID=A0A803QRW7_CANSA
SRVVSVLARVQSVGGSQIRDTYYLLVQALLEILNPISRPYVVPFSCADHEPGPSFKFVVLGFKAPGIGIGSGPEVSSSNPDPECGFSLWSKSLGPDSRSKDLDPTQGLALVLKFQVPAPSLGLREGL